MRTSEILVTYLVLNKNGEDREHAGRLCPINFSITRMDRSKMLPSLIRSNSFYATGSFALEAADYALHNMTQS